MEATLLIVDADKLPKGLEELLTQKGVFVEAIPAAHLGAAIVAAAPDLVLAPHSLDLDRILTVLRGQEPLMQVVLIADWKEHKALRARKDPVIGAVLARDTPLKLLAGRIVEFCERAAAREPLQRVPSLVPPPGPVTKPAVAQHATVRDPVPRVTSSPATVSRAAAPAVTSSSSPVSRAAVPRVTSSPAPASRAAIPLVTSSPAPVSRAASPLVTSSPASATRPAAHSTPVRAEPALSRGMSSSAAADLAQPEVARELDLQVLEAPVPTAVAARAALAPGPAAAATAVAALATTAAPTPEATPTFEAEPAAADTAMDTTAPATSEPISEAVRISRPSAEPASERVPLTFSQRPLPAVRLALIDRDPTRSGAIGDKLRERGVKTQLVSPARDATRWHLLRRFSPHALVVDERGLESNHDWLDAIRLDPFLQHVPLLVLPLSRVFEARTGQTDLSLLVPHVLAMGAEEAAFQTQLSPTRHLELRLDQLGPLRLFDCLASHPRPTRLECRSEDSRFSLTVQGGLVGSAELMTSAGAAAEPLDLAHALDWVLAHPESRVLVKETEPTTLHDSQAVRAWLDEATETEAVPEAPPRQVKKLVTHAPPPREAAWRTSLRQVPPQLQGLKARAVALSPRAKLSAAAIVGAVALGGIVGLVKRGSSAEAPPAPAAAPVVARPAPPPVVEPISPEMLRFAVSDAKLPGCDEVAADAHENATLATTHLQNARRALMTGDREEARGLMCKAARLAPAGPAAEGLAVLFLSDRSLDNADVWAKVVERNHPGDRVTEELLGDIQSQRGNVKAARTHWLLSLGVAEDNAAVLSAVARTWLKDAARSKKSRDLPRAERFLRRAATIEVTQPAAPLALAELFVEQEMFDQARAWAEHVLELAPAETRARLILGELAERRGAVVEAREQYAKIPADDAAAPKARERLAALSTSDK